MFFMRKIKIKNIEPQILIPVKVEPYIWHLSPKRNRLSILKNGLLIGNNSNFIFANNFNYNTISMWPLPIESMNFNLGVGIINYSDAKNIILGLIGPFYDFWKIDTQKFNKQWYIDPFLKDELNTYSYCHNNPANYVCTQSSVPTKYLELFEYNPILKEEILVVKNDGVTHTYGTKLPLKKIKKIFYE